MRKLELVKALVLTSALTIFAAACRPGASEKDFTAQRIADREAIEDVVNRANLGFELSDPDLFAGAYAEDGIFQLDAKGPVFGFDKMTYQGRGDIRSIIADRAEKMKKTDPKTLSFDPATLKMYIRNSDERIVILDPKTARHTSTWMAVIKTNVDIHISAVGRYQDAIEKRDGKWLIVKRVRTE
ncbi:MAG: nuclear transport factor 2 family protein [Acidobacteria bacterium]|nr:nuclear transport factor 2 family protein [Acidobacteriota bacterium]